MATIIDSLVVELGLDASKFEKGQRQAVESLRKFEKDATKHTGNALEGFDKLSASFKELQGRLLAIGALIAAGLGFNRLMQDATKLNSELGYMSKQIGVSAQEFSKWQLAGATVGATAQDIASSFSVIQKSMADMQLGKGSFLHEFARTTHVMGQGPAVELYDQKGQARKSSDILVDISKWYAAQQDKNVATRLMEQIGFGKGMINMIGLGPEELQKRLKEAEAFAPSDEQIKKFQALQEQFGKLAVVVEALTRAFAEKLAPILTKILKLINEVLSRWYSGENPADAAADSLAKGGMKELTPNPEKPGLFSRGWSWLKKKTGFGGTEEGGGSAPGGATSGTSASDAASPMGTSNGTLAEQRKSFQEQLKNNPELREKILRIMYNEQGKNPEGTQAIAESMMNRALVRGTSLEKEARWAQSEGGYYDQGNMGRGALENPQVRDLLEKSLDRALAGGNVSNYATDNASSWLAEKHKVTGQFIPTRDKLHGETFFSPDTRISSHMTRWLAWKERAEAMERTRKASTGGGGTGGSKGDDLTPSERQLMDLVKPGPRRPVVPGSGVPSADGPGTPADGAAARSFDRWKNLGIGAQGAVARGGDSNVSNTTTNSTHIGTMNVTPPPGGDPGEYGAGIRSELRRFDNVQNANTGLR